MPYRSTREVAHLLGIPPGRLAKALWDGRVEAPAKGPGGAYLWTDRDIEHASWIIRHRDANDILPAQEVST